MSAAGWLAWITSPLVLVDRPRADVDEHQDHAPAGADVDEHRRAYDVRALAGFADMLDLLCGPNPELAGEFARIRAQGDLVRWAIADAQRDQLVRRAVALGVPKMQVHRLTGISRTTIDRIVDQHG